MYKKICERTISGTQTVNADAFIIPKTATRVDEFIDGQESRTDLANWLTTTNTGKPFDPNTDKLVELWFTATEDLKCENLVDHLFVLSVDGEDHDFRLKTGWVPSSILAGHKEGEVIEFQYPITTWDEETPVTIILHMHLRLAQKEYRYCRYGKFEEVLERVLSL